MKISSTILFVTLIGLTVMACKQSNSDTPKAAAKPVATKEIASANLDSTRFHIEGMTCAVGCAKTIETKLNETPGVQKATVNFDKKEAVVAFDKTQHSKKSLTQLVESCADGTTYKVID
ncbi:MAG: heavy-metal-associated domain-containing protein [Flavobacterium sp.]|nr:heavy-metal-associated domain-containing protein [Flavobacterium sp.]